MKSTFKYLIAFGAAAGLQAAHGQTPNYPSRPVTMVVPFAAGGPTDVVARGLAAAMEKTLGGNVIVENKPSAGGIVAAAEVARAPADGYKILIHHIGMSTAPALYRSLKFDVTKDFEYVALVNQVPMTLVSKPDFAPKALPELVQYVKANANKVTLANAGIGSASHLCGLLFQQAIQQELTTVPYKGTAPAMTDIMGGQVDLLCDQTTQTTQHIRSGKVKGYAATTPQRVETLKDLPTAGEQGLKGFEVAVWHGIYAPKGTPKPVVDKLVAAIQAALVEPNLVKRFEELGAVSFTPAQQTPAGLKAHLDAEIGKWGPIIKKAGVYAD